MSEITIDELNQAYREGVINWPEYVQMCWMLGYRFVLIRGATFYES